MSNPLFAEYKTGGFVGCVAPNDIYRQAADRVHREGQDPAGVYVCALDPADPAIPANDFALALDDPDHAYHGLAKVLLRAYTQAAIGKGKERHAQDLPFTEQPMQTASRLVGSHDGLAYQAIKKIQESQRLSHDAAIRELLGTIVYTAGNVIFREAKHGNLNAPATDS